ncbi:MAG: nitrate/nitrite transporter NrtS [Acidobacteria bacterium]|nr:nitrate/nitrite transporter NrtS [Acidobacteriota bacterium]
MREWWQLATQKKVVKRALTYALVVGTVLITINHGDAILSGDLNSGRLLKMGLTVMVPYLVSTFSSVGAIRSLQH